MSAYFDGETSPAETVIVERRLQLSPEARRELSEIKQLSQWLGELSRVPAPGALRANVMQAARNGNGHLGGRQPSTATKPRRCWNGRFTQVAALTVTAAALCVMVHGLRSSTPPGSTGGVAVVARSTVAQSNGVTPDDAAKRDVLTRDVAMQNVVLREREQFAPEFPTETLDVERVEKLNVIAEKTSSADSIEAHTGRSRLVFDGNLKQAQVGQVVKALETSGDEIAVVELTVIDRHAGLEALQILLQRNEIPMQHVVTHDQPPAAGNQIVAVHVDVTQDKLAQTLYELRKERAFHSQQAATPISNSRKDRLATSFRAKRFNKSKSRRMANHVHRARPMHVLLHLVVVKGGE